ncbi:sulfotransferase family domain-containing protein [Ditylenchus destructor]|nr:sulfotransferase family domain-containing protein [Ditylenchus destructor]
MWTQLGRFTMERSIILTQTALVPLGTPRNNNSIFKRSSWRPNFVDRNTKCSDSRVTDSSVNSSLDRKTYKCVNWTEVETVTTDTPTAVKEGQTSGPELLNVLDFITKHNSNIIPEKSYFGSTYPQMSICKNNDSSASLCVPQFGPWPSNSFAMAPNSKTVACRIQKSMSTVLDNLICYLYDEKAFRACKYKNFATNQRLCEDRIDAANLTSITRSQNISSLEHMFQHWNVFAVIRHPIDRLLSGFLDKCISHPIYLDTGTEEDKFTCHGCGANFTCFVINQYHRLMAQSQHPEYRVTNADLHFFPQSWRCEFKKFLPNISIVKYSNPQTGKYDADLIIDGLMKILQQKNNHGETLSQRLRMPGGVVKSEATLENHMKAEPEVISKKWLYAGASGFDKSPPGCWEATPDDKSKHYQPG